VHEGHPALLLQLDGDSQVKVHSSFESIQAFIEHCVAEFAAGGSSETVLVFKNHPLDQGVLDRAAVIHAAARRHGLADRVFFIETGKLVPLLDRTISVTAINSTACHQSLRRGIPTMVLGKAVFNHPEIVPRMRLADFYRLRPVSGTADYEKLVALLRQTSQIFGGFYSRAARKLVLPALASRLIDGGSRVGDFVTPAHQAESRPSLRRS
jgi:capsular polysaccharide export protein